MAFCPNCGAQIEDNAVFCGNCGAALNVPEYNTAAPENQGSTEQPYTAPIPEYTAPSQAYYAPTYVDPTDHTAEFDPKDISDNKVIAMATYLLSTIGIIIALLAAHESKYAAFHSRQALKLSLVSILLGIVSVLLCWTVIVPIAAGICYIVLFVIRIIGFFNVCSGKAKELPIIRSLGFLK